MALVFWDVEDILFVDDHENGQVINGEYYAHLLTKLRERIKETGREKLRSGVLLLQDNDPVYTAKIAVEAAVRCSFKLLLNPPYFVDLTPPNVYLFPKIKEELRGKQYSIDTEVIEAVEEYLEGYDKQSFLDGTMKLERRWKKYIDVQGGYIEK